MRKKTSRPKIPPKELREIWDKIPGMKECKGKCHTSCGPVPAASIERKLIEERSGKKLRVDANMDCSMLVNGKCTVYGIRPLICRAWGAITKLPCVYGCEPERYLTDEEALALFAELEELDGDVNSDRMVEAMVAGMTPMQQRRWRAEKRAWFRKWGLPDGAA